MISETPLIGGFCRLYSALLYAYPPDFRRQYGRPMEQLFRDRCRDLAREAGPLRLLRFAVQIMSDWLGTVVREGGAALRTAGRRSGYRSSVTEWAGSILIYLFATSALVQAYVIPTGSMESSLLVGDHILVDRVAYSDPGPLGRRILPYRDVQRGDLACVLYPEDVRRTYVKRIVGLPGDRIRLEHGQVIRNGRRLVEPYVQHVATFRDPYRDDFPQPPGIYTTPRGRDMLDHDVRNGEVVVPPGMLFALGDNRDDSLDSRYWGFVPRNYVVGKPLLVYWSYDAPTADLETWTWHHAIDLAGHFLTRTRWRRTFLVPRSQAAEEIGGTQ
jgi:signal peptidase I